MPESNAPQANASLTYRLSRRNVELARLHLPRRAQWPLNFTVELEMLDWMRDRKGGRSQRMTMLAQMLEGARERKLVLAPEASWKQLLKAYPRLTGPNCEFFCVHVDGEELPRKARLVGFAWRTGGLIFKVGRPA